MHSRFYHLLGSSLVLLVQLRVSARKRNRVAVDEQVLYLRADLERVTVSHDQISDLALFDRADAIGNAKNFSRVDCTALTLPLWQTKLEAIPRDKGSRYRRERLERDLHSRFAAAPRLKGRSSGRLMLASKPDHDTGMFSL